MKWMTQDSQDWTPKTMREFILAQNSYSYDGESPMQHSAEKLANFAYLKDKQREKFVKIYNSLYEVA